MTVLSENKTKGLSIFMGLKKRFFQNARKPKGIGGRVMLFRMNIRHNANALWGLSHVEIPPAAKILDIGCGGGKNMRNLLRRAPQGSIFGVDYSPDSVVLSTRSNKRAIRQGRAGVSQASVSSLPFQDGQFDVITAFETIYFWPDLPHDFMEVRRVLKGNGIFLICNGSARPEGNEKWIDLLDMPIYTAENLSETLLDAGFCDIDSKEHPNGDWLFVTARNPG